MCHFVKSFLRSSFALAKALPIFFFYFLARILPINLSSFIFGKIARLCGPLLAVHRLGRSNLQQAFPEKKPSEIEDILKGVWENLGRIAGEFPHMEKIALQPHRISIQNEELLDTLLSQNKPILFMAGHLGNWELPHYIVSTKKKSPIALISRPPNNPWVKRLFDWARYHPLVTIFFKSTQGSKQIMQYLMKGGTLGILFDQRLSDGIPLPFFGKPALTAMGPAKLAKKYGGLFVPVQVERLGPFPKFCVTFHDPIDPTLSAEEMMIVLNKQLETWVKKNPEQWLWLHKRWKV